MTISVIGAPGAGGQRLRSPQRAVATVRVANRRAAIASPKPTRLAAAWECVGLGREERCSSVAMIDPARRYCAEALREAVGLPSTILSNSSLSTTCDHIG